jgi:hypothetical protein
VSGAFATGCDKWKITRERCAEFFWGGAQQYSREMLQYFFRRRSPTVFFLGREVRHIFLEGSVMDLRERHERDVIEGELKRRGWIIWKTFNYFQKLIFVVHDDV